MDFQSVNLLNVRMNTLSGNLFPMSPDSRFSIVWKIYSGFIWLIQFIRAGAIIPGVMYVSREKAMKDATVVIIFIVEVTFMVMRIQSRDVLIRQFIQKLNDILRIEDKTMKDVLMTTMKPMKVLLRFYWITGLTGVTIWGIMPFLLLFKKSSFYYEDYRIPIILSKQPFSNGIFVLGSLLILTCSITIFLKKVSLDIYMMHLVLMITVQYRYIAVKFQKLFQERNLENERDSSAERHSRRTDSRAEKEIRAICRHHNTVIQLSFMLKKLLAVNFSLIYVNSVLRFSFIGIMLSVALSSVLFVESISIFMFACAEMLQFYILCSCVQQLLDASTTITDMAFHENWYRFEISVKRIFILMILSNSLECKLAAFDKFNLSLPSFMTVMNQAYSIALLFLKVK